MIQKTINALQRTMIALLLTLLSYSPCYTAEMGQIIVNIEGIRSEQGGNLVIALFDTEGSWPKHNSALASRRIPVTAPTLQTTFDSILINGYYAIQVIHDENANNKLDFRWLPYPKPKEGVGVSNNNRRIGPPSFDKALFQAKGKQTVVTIRMNY